VITADGKGIPVRPDALRSGTAKLAAKAKASGTGGGGVSGGEGTLHGKANRKRMAELVCVYDLAPVPRTVDDILPDPAGDDETSVPTGAPAGGGDPEQAAVKAPKAAGKWLAASLVQDIPTVIAAGFDEATRRDPGHDRDWIALVDGNTTQIEAITAEASGDLIRGEIAEEELALDPVDGVEIVFGIPGQHALSLWEALRGSSIRPVVVRHEQAAAFAAVGYDVHKLARIFNTTPRSIWRWQVEGAPGHIALAIEEWLSGRLKDKGVRQRRR